MSGPTVLVLGGLGLDQTRFLLPYLLTSASPPPAFVRVVDKYLAIVQADAYTTYVDTACRAAFKKGVADGTLEYVQGNLLTEATRTKAFTLPDAHGGPSKAFDWVFDYTGEGDVQDVVHVERTLKLSLLLGQEAAKHSVGAYIKTLTSFYKLVSGKGKVGGADASEPWGTRGGWYHEAARGLAQIKGLKVVFLRPALLYGPYTVTGVTPRVLIGEVYRFENEKLEFLWGESLPQNTVHCTDFASACVAVAQWAIKTPASELVTLAGEDLPTTLKSNDAIKDVPGAAKKEDKVKAAVFNIVDAGQTTSGDIANVTSKVVGVESGFHGSVVAAFAKLNMSSVVEDVNEKHLESWSALLSASKPPISTTVPISPNVGSDLLQPYPIDMDGGKIEKIVGWKPAHALTVEVIKDTVEKFTTEGHWPRGYTPKSKKK